MAKKKDIWLIEDANDCLDPKTKKAVPFYSYDVDREPETVKAKNASKATMDQLTDLCDRDAENRNKHAFVGSHRALGELLTTRLGAMAATNLMRDIAYAGGLHEMTEVQS